MLDIFVFVVVAIFFVGMIFIAKDSINHANLKA